MQPTRSLLRDAAVAVNPDILVLCHGGPIAEPEDAKYIPEHPASRASSARAVLSGWRWNWRLSSRRGGLRA